MNAQTIVYGDTAIDDLLRWLRAQGEPQDIEKVVEQYLTILQSLVVKEKK